MTNNKKQKPTNKKQTDMKKSVQKIQALFTKLFAMLVVLVALPAISYCQPVEPVDDNPDVPFDNNMNIMFLITGVLFAGVIVWQEIRKRRKLQGSDVK